MGALCLLLVLLSAAGCSALEGPRRHKCEPITVSLCRDMPYNVTRMPNLLEHETQEEAAAMLQQFVPLVDSHCSSRLKFFLCSLFAPMCSEMVDAPIPSCQSVCFDVRSRCLPLLRSFGIGWPAMLNCSRLPAAGHERRDGLCMAYPTGEGEDTSPPPPPPPPVDRRRLMARYPHLDWSSLLQPTEAPGAPADTSCPPGYLRVAGAADGGARAACRSACGANLLFTGADKRLAELWLAAWSALCLLASLFTVLSVWLGAARLEYPARPLVFLCGCQALCALGVLTRLLLGAEKAACHAAPDGGLVLASGGLDSAGCIVTFLVRYYFGVAAALWWAALAAVWALRFARGWSRQALRHLAPRLHALCWGAPAVLAAAALTAQTIGADELTALCQVTRRPLPLLTLLALPLALALLAGAGCLVLGASALVASRRQLQKSAGSPVPAGTAASSALRLGVFLAVTAVSAALTLTCLVYEAVQTEHWEAAALRRAAACQEPAGCPPEVSVAPVAVPLLRLAATLVAGVASAPWVWSAETAAGWARLGHLLCCRRPTADKTAAYLPGRRGPSAAGTGHLQVLPAPGTGRRVSPV
ncbi:frizzled-10-like [Amphibalanus amphitrite]|uniref:frizzled-10-like n=1 Tax=Amphibalanus amphitrite TaxID=1232801 RepID=UPI001C92039B|nr:frizzled-10-like [Amphibalanus amphitrite]